MAMLPPRRNQTPTKKISKEHKLTPLQTLLQLGFPKHRAEKALAATGHRGAQLASDWLLAHVRDQSLDSNEPREYILYACPTGIFGEKLAKFWVESRKLEWNNAHNYTPHITLIKFFKVPDESSEQVGNALETLLTDQNECRLDRVDIETYISPNFMGLFLAEKHTAILESITNRYVNKLASLGITAEAHTGSLHISLAYQFSSNYFQQLRTMVERFDPLLLPMNNWELRLYSRDSRFRESHVYTVTHAHVPRGNADELELRPGDYIYLPENAREKSLDGGWVEGVSWLTGISGYLPLNHTQRTALTDSWTLHATLPLSNPSADSPELDIPKFRRPPPSHVLLSTSSRSSRSSSSSSSSSSGGGGGGGSIDTPDGVVVDNEPVEGSLPPTIESSRDLYVCRHGERVDFTFGTWIPYCFEPDGCYIRRDLNMPQELPRRNVQDFQNDSPLTTLGEIQAHLVGEAMKSSNVKIDVVFSSPSLRCIQTLSQMLKALGSSIEIKVEPGLIEWLAWYPNGLPAWMNYEELIKAGFNIDKNYKPVVRSEDLPARENAAQYYERSHNLIKRIIESTDGNILIVAHAASLAACTRQLTGGRVPPAAEVTRLVQRVPYLACLTARKGLTGWQLQPPPFPPITHTSNNRFDWKILM